MRLDLGLLGLLADGRVGVHLLEQAARGERIAEGDVDVVPAIEQVGGAAGAILLEGGDRGRERAASWSVVRVVSQADQASVPASAAGRVSGARSVTP